MNIRLSLACAGMFALALPSLGAAASPDATSGYGSVSGSVPVLAQLGGASPGGGSPAAAPPPAAPPAASPGSAAQPAPLGGGGGGNVMQRGGGGGGTVVQPGGSRGGGTVTQRGLGGPGSVQTERQGPRWTGRTDWRREGLRSRDGLRGDRWRHRGRHGWRGGYYAAPLVGVYGVRGWCHRHHWSWRVMRHCHPYRYRWHRHGPWR